MEGGYVKVYRSLKRRPPFNSRPEMLLLYTYLLINADYPENTLEVKSDVLAKIFGRDRSTVTRWLDTLQTTGHLQITRRSHSVVVKLLTVDESVVGVEQNAGHLQDTCRTLAGHESDIPTVSSFPDPLKNRRKKNKEEQEKTTSSLCQPAVPYEEILLAWNSNKELPKCIKLTDERKKKIALRWKEHPDINVWIGACQRLAISDFATGRTGGTWRASFEWLIRSGENIVKTLEGKYDNRASISPVRNHNESIAREILAEEEPS